MVNLKRQISSEDSQRGEREDTKYLQTKVVMSDRTKRPETVLEMDTLTAETSITLTQEYIKELIIKGNQTRRRKCTCLNAYLTLIGIVVTGLVLWNLRGILEPTARIDRPDGSNETTNKQNTAEFSKLTGGTKIALESMRPEEYEIETGPLFENKVVIWKGQSGNRNEISETSTKYGCIRMKIRAMLKIFNAITFSYKDQSSIFHAIAHCTATSCDVIKKASFSWSQAQSGKQPSILQFLVQVEQGDELCLQTTDTSLIYAGVQDNVFLIEKVSEG